MMQFDWMNAWDKSMYYDVETSKSWATIVANYHTLGEAPRYEYDGDVYLDLDKLKQVIENKFSRYGSRINSVKDSL